MHGMGRRRKIEVPKQSHTQFELGDTAEVIERRRKERQERAKRQEQEETDRERLESERTERTEQMDQTKERTEKQPRTNRETDVESTQSRQKKGQMKSIFLSDSHEEAIVEFVKQNAELYNRTRTKFKDKQRKKGLWEIVAARNLLIIGQHCQKVVRDSTYQIWQAHSHEVRTSCSEEQ